MATTYTTNVASRTDRVKLIAVLAADGAVELQWAEHYVRGELSACGPSIAMLPRDLRADCEGRLASLFDGTMLWSKAH